MANYTFRDKASGEEFDISMPIAELDEFKNQNPHLEQMLRSMNLCDPVLVGIGAKPDGGMREVLQEMKKKVPHNTINSF